MSDIEVETEEECEEREQWRAYVPEMLTALAVGYLDKELNTLLAGILERRSEIGATVKVKRPKPRGIVTPGAGIGNSFASIPAPYATRQDIIDGRFDPGQYATAMVLQGGDYYRKSDINDAGLKFIQNNITFELLGTNKFRGCHFELVSIKRTRAIVTVVSMDMYLTKVHIGSQITVPLDWLVRSMRAVQFPVNKV